MMKTIEQISEELRQKNKNKSERTVKPSGNGKVVALYSDGFDGSSQDQNAENWPEPKSLPDGLHPVPQLPESIIPEALRGWLADISERLQVPLDYPASTGIVALASVIGSQLRIRPKRRDDWTVTPNLWGAVVGRPSTMKSPAIEEALKPLRRLVKDAEEEHAERCRSFFTEKTRFEVKQAATKEQMKAAAKKGHDIDHFTLDDPEPQEPHERRYIANDTTVQMYGVLLNQNPNGLLLFRHELTGWLRSLDDEQHQSDRAFYLEAWDCKPFVYDRIGRGKLMIENTTTSIFGGIQPSKIQVYLREALGFGGNDGLLQRFQMMVYPDEPVDWKLIDRWPDSKARDLAFDTFKSLANLNVAALAPERDMDGKPFVRFSDDAQDFFNVWLFEMMMELRSGKIEHPLLEEHFGKYRKLVPSLSLVFHLADTIANPEPVVSLSAVERATGWFTYLWEHAQRVYGLAIGDSAIKARAIARKLQGDALKDGFTAREVWIKNWSGLDSAESVKEPLDVLEGLDWLRSVEIRNPAGGRPTVQYLINPKIKQVKL
jgi:uncharacterized protein DUF3987